MLLFYFYTSYQTPTKQKHIFNIMRNTIILLQQLQMKTTLVQWFSNWFGTHYHHKMTSHDPHKNLMYYVNRIYIEEILKGQNHDRNDSETLKETHYLYILEDEY